MTEDRAIKLAGETGFSHWGIFDAGRLEPLPAVREMCASDKCRSYGRSWSCPPACGSLEEIRERLSGYARGIALQTTGSIEDSFDYEGMQAVEKRHKAAMESYHGLMGEDGGHLPLSSGACTICGRCTYPDEACRYPGRMMSSMEAYGLLVQDVCALAGIRYRYGDGTVTFTGCVLF